MAGTEAGGVVLARSGINIRTAGRKPDELALMGWVVAGMWPRMAGEILQMPERRIMYLCGKWAKEGWYEWGGTQDLGWVK